MNTKKILLWNILLFFFASCGEENIIIKNQANEPKEIVVEPEIEVALDGPVAYKNYDEDNYLTRWEPTVMFFYSESCEVCKLMDIDILSQGQLPAWVNIIKVDFDSEAELNEKYWITTENTYVLLDVAGNIAATETGFNEARDVIDFVMMSKLPGWALDKKPGWR